MQIQNLVDLLKKMWNLQKRFSWKLIITKTNLFQVSQKQKNMGIQVLRGKMLKIKIIALLVNTFVEKSYQQIYATSTALHWRMYIWRMYILEVCILSINSLGFSTFEKFWTLKQKLLLLFFTTKTCKQCSVKYVHQNWLARTLTKV